MAMSRTSRIIIHVFLIIICVIYAYPLLWLLLSSLKLNGEFFSNFWGLPSHWLFGNYSFAWQMGQLGVAFINSIYVTVFSLLLVLVVSYFAAYALARHEFRGKRLLTGFILLPILIPGGGGFIPLYKLEVALGLFNTRWGLILPYVASGISLPIIILTQYIRTISSELDDAAQIDGCSKFMTLWRIILPLSRPALASVGILTFISVWNEFFLALIMIQDPNKRTLPVQMLNFQNVFTGTDYVHVFAAMSMSIVPVVVIFVVFQKWFVSGITQGGLKM